MFARDVLEVRCELRDEREVSCLPWRSLGGAVNGVRERFVIGESCEWTTFEKVSEVFDGAKYSQEFPVKGSIFCLGR